ncbi:MAG: hypothetical protein R2752_16870 [Vicinamibacterales bacterium]
MSYEHTQVARPFQLMLALFALVAAAGAASLLPLPAGWAMVAVVVLLTLASLMTRLTVRVGEGRLEHEFGFAVWRKTIAIDRIASAEPVRNAWWYGFGIRLTPHGWLYNVWGLDAVEIRLEGGRTFRLGTDEPRELARAIREAAGLPAGVAARD